MRAFSGLILIWLGCVPLLAQPAARPTSWLDLKIPSIDVDGTWRDFAKALHRYGLRVNIEDIVLAGMNADEVRVSIRASDISLRDLLNQMAEQSPDLGWEESGFEMCRSIELFRKRSRWNPTKNPLNIKFKEFSFKDKKFKLTSGFLSELVYNHSPELQNFVNPLKLSPGGAVPGSVLGGTPTNGYRAEIRHSVVFQNTTLRDILNGLACISTNGGLSWCFSYDSSRDYPWNYKADFF